MWENRQRMGTYDGAVKNVHVQETVAHKANHAPSNITKIPLHHDSVHDLTRSSVINVLNCKRALTKLRKQSYPSRVIPAHQRTIQSLKHYKMTFNLEISVLHIAVKINDSTTTRIGFLFA